MNRLTEYWMFPQSAPLCEWKFKDTLVVLFGGGFLCMAIALWIEMAWAVHI